MDSFNKIIWSIAIIFIIVNSVYFTIKTKFSQFKLINVFKSLKKERDCINISPFDTLIMALSSKIGVGSLAGIAICIYYGGIGTIFWIWISTFFLAILTYIENALAIIYKEKDGTYNKSGPTYYIKKGLNNKILSVVYAILILITYTFLFSSIQNNTISTLVTNMYNINEIVISLSITIFSGYIILKGIKTISSICNKIFPIMMIIFLLIGIIIIISNLSEMPMLFKTIVKEAMNNNSLSGGMIYTFIIAIQKSVFASESGVGTSAIISGSTENNNYKLQGNIGIIQTYFINFIVLTITAIIIGTTNYNNINIINGIELTKYAFSYHLGSFGENILLIILLLFSFSTIITIYYYGESNLKSITTKKLFINILKIITITFVFIGGIVKGSIIWSLIDTFLALLIIINMYAIFKLKDKVISMLVKK